METGYHLYRFTGEILREEHVDAFKQFAWRPRPPLMLSKEEQKNVRRNLREYSRVFEEQDAARANQASQEVIDERRRLLREWFTWREETVADLREMRAEHGLPPDPVEAAAEEEEEMGEGKVVEEIVEEIIKETEEVV